MVMPLTLNYPYWTGKSHLYYKQIQKQVYFSISKFKSKYISLWDVITVTNVHF